MIDRILLAGRDRAAVEADVTAALAPLGAEVWIVEPRRLRAIGSGVTAPCAPADWPDRWRGSEPPDGLEVLGPDTVGYTLRVGGRVLGALVGPHGCARRLARMRDALAVLLANLEEVESGRRARELDEVGRRLSELMSSEVTFAELMAAIEELLGHQVELVDEPGCTERASVGGATAGFGWLATDADLDEHGRARLERAAGVLALHLQHERAVTQARHQLRGEFLDEVMANDGTSTRNILARGTYLGVDLSRPVAVIFMRSEGKGLDEHSRRRLERAIEELAPKALAAARFGGGVVLAPGKHPRDFAEQLHERMAKETDIAFTIGYAPDVVTIGQVGDAVQGATQAVRGARVLGRTGTVVCREELGLYGSILAADDGELSAFAGRLLVPLVDYDREHGSDLVGTLSTYLECGCNVTEAARRLIIHANSLYYRLGRIRELADYDLEDSDVRFELQLALRVLRAPHAP